LCDVLHTYPPLKVFTKYILKSVKTVDEIGLSMHKHLRATPGKFFNSLVSLALLPSICSAVEDTTAFDMSLSELSKVAVVSPATLTTIEDGSIPPSVTVITEKQINTSGARTVDELLERYVPGLQVSSQDFGTNNLSNRGILGNEHFLLLVNGKTMNDRSQSGAITE
jgi:outer membrane receptor for ferrienterochelin and colicin